MTAASPAIVIVDDDEAVCDSTRFLLETYGLEVQTYQRGADFLRDDPPTACLIVDYQMPELNGFELIRELQNRGRQVPTIIMITATTDASVERRAAELGIQIVLKKPFSNQVLLGAIRDAVDRG